MTLILSGTDGLSDIDGSAATPAIRGTDANTGIFFGADIIGFAEGGAEVARFNADAQFVAAAGTAALPVITTTGDTNTGIFFPAADTIAFSEGGVEAMRIDSSGNLGIATTVSLSRLTSLGASSTVTNGASTRNPVASFRGGNDNNRLDVYVDNSGAASIMGLGAYNVAGANTAMAFYTGNTVAEAMRIDSSGGLILVGSTAQKATGTTWSNPSDQRLKSNIQDYAKGTAELMQVRVREWEYNGKGGTTDGMKGLGVIADEVMMVLPDTVENYSAKLNADDEETTAIKKFDATEITWLLVKTVQEQQALIQSLTARITALETQNVDNPPQGETP